MFLFSCFRDEEHQIAIYSQDRKRLICRRRIAPILKRARFWFIVKSQTPASVVSF